MRAPGLLVVFACAMAISAPCRAAKSKKTKTRLYRNPSSGSCVEIPAKWAGPAEVASHPGGRFDAPGGEASITFALSPNQPHSTVLGQKDAGDQMASLNDFREAIPNTWRNDRGISHVKVVHEEAATLDGVPSLDLELAYKRSRAARRYEIVFALLNNEQFALGYDATKRSAKRYENDFHEAVRSFHFQCPASER